MENDIDIIQSICFDLKEAIDDLFHHIKTIKQDVEMLKTQQAKGSQDN